MITRSVAEKIKGTEGLQTISALTHPEIFALVERKVINAELFDEKNILEVVDPENPALRYCLCRNPKSAERETATRLRLLECTRQGLEKIANAKNRAEEAKIGSRVGRVLQQFKMGKFVHWEVIDGRLSWNFEEQKIATEALFDGCTIITSEVSKERMATTEVVASYKSLSLVEQSFGNLKTVQLEVRPVYHKTDDRIRSHVFLCTLAYYLQWHANKRLQSFFAADGTHKHRQWTLRSVIERLCAIRRERLTMAGVEFDKVTTPQADQQSILAALGVKM